MKNQVFIVGVKVFIGLLLVSCGGNDVADVPLTKIGETAVSPISTPTVAAVPSEPAVTPTLLAPTLLTTPLATNEPTAIPTVESAVEDTFGDSIGDPYAPELGNTGYDVQHYTIQMELDPIVTQIVATVGINAVVTEADLSQLWLDFVGFDILSLQVNGDATPFERVDDKLHVMLSQPLAANASFTMLIQYEGTPVKESSRYVEFAPSIGMQFVNGETIYVLSEPDGARYWFPNNDHPRDKATFRFEISVPEGLTAVANGQLIDDQNNTFIWEHNHPMASYLAIIAVGEYERIEDVSPNGVPIRHYAFLEEEGEGTENFDRATGITGEVVDWMSDLFGEYPFETIGFVTADAPGASLETQTMILLSSQMVGQQTVVHELAHMWFGDWVSLDSWSEMWRNEGFATYVTLMWEHRNDADAEGLELELAAIETAVLENTPHYPLGSPPPSSLFGFNTYFEGALMVHELRQTMGDEAFFTGLKAYFEEYGGGTASDAQFQAVMEAVSGLMLDEFFAEWLE